MNATVLSDRARRVASARLDDRASQHVFRVLLASLSRPGLPVACPSLEGPLTPAAILVRALADVGVDIAVPDDADLGDVLAIATGARLVEAAQAALVVASRDSNPVLLTRLRTGTDLEPELGARVAWPVGAFGERGLRIRLSGPGVDGEVVLDVRGIDRAVLVNLISINRAYPRGVDLWLCSPTAVVGLPRSARLVLED